MANQLFLLLAVTASLSDGVPEQQLLDFKNRNLQTLEEVCDELRGEIDDDIVRTVADSCTCKEDEGSQSLECKIDNFCMSSGGADPMRGDFSATFEKQGDGPSYTQTLESTTCFQYPSDMYDGKEVCLSTTDDGLGGFSQCTIQVGNDFCPVCRFCPINLISFDCTNVGAEDRSACADDNANGTILQFMREPQLSSECPSDGSGSSASPTGFPTASPSSAGIANVIFAFALGLLPLFLME